MRIEAYNQVQQLYQTKKLNQTQKATNAYPVDQLQISSRGRDFQIAKSAVQASPDIREACGDCFLQKCPSTLYIFVTSDCFAKYNLSIEYAPSLFFIYKSAYLPIFSYLCPKRVRCFRF